MFAFLFGHANLEPKSLPPDRERLRIALRRNAENGVAIRMDPRDTTFIDEDPGDEPEVLNAIKSVPTHY